MIKLIIKPGRNYLAVYLSFHRGPYIVFPLKIETDVGEIKPFIKKKLCEEIDKAQISFEEQNNSSLIYED